MVPSELGEWELRGFRRPGSGGHLVSAVVSCHDQDLAGAGLAGLVAGRVRPGGACGAGSPLKVASLAAGMAAGADPAGGMGVLRRGAMGVVLSGIGARSTRSQHQSRDLGGKRPRPGLVDPGLA